MAHNITIKLKIMKKKTLKRLDNYIVYSCGQKGMESIGISTAEGDWKLEYRFDSPMCVSLRAMLDNDDVLREFCTLMFVTTYTFHSAGVYEAIRDSVIKELKDVGIPDLDGEDDDDILHDTVEMETLKQRLYEDGTLQN